MTRPRICSGCQRPFVHHRKREDVCPSCRAGDGPAAVFIDHRLNVVALRVGAKSLSNVIAELDREGFKVAPPGAALVPSEWLLRLKAILRPEEIDLDTAHPFTAEGFKALADHIDALPAVQAITGEKPS